MPHMSGFQVLWRIRDIDRESGRVTPAIAVTAHATDEQIARSAQAGFQMHITKPFDANRLIRTVSAVRARV
jgi:CheY-like chemotaxis protein